jgi:hypothetical protein
MSLKWETKRAEHVEKIITPKIWRKIGTYSDRLLALHSPQGTFCGKVWQDESRIDLHEFRKFKGIGNCSRVNGLAIKKPFSGKRRQGLKIE